MFYDFRVQITRKGWPAASIAQIRQATEKVMHDIGAAWYAKDLPKHFEKSATFRYGYADRSQIHKRKKRIKYGHTKPLVYSGEMKREALSRARITGKRNVSVKFKARAANFSGKVAKLPKTRDGIVRAGIYPNVRMELKAITLQEIKTLSRLGRQSATKRINALKAIEVKTTI